MVDVAAINFIAVQLYQYKSTNTDSCGALLAGVCGRRGSDGGCTVASWMGGGSFKAHVHTYADVC